jgi:hypothetical protein
MASEAKAVAKVGANEIATLGNYAIVTMDQERLRRTIRDNIGTDRITPNDLDRVSIPSGGSTTWEVPSLDGDESVKEITGIIIYWKQTRGYWPEGQPLGSAPQCWSDDAIIGHGIPGDTLPGNQCALCPMAAWGSDPKGGKGQACKLMRPLFMVREGSLLPIVVNLPPTSVQPCKKFFLRLASAGGSYDEVITTISLTKTISDDGNPYSIANFKIDRHLTPEESERVRAYVTDIRPALESVRIDAAAQSAVQADNL